MTIRYRIVPKNPEAHLFEVACTVAEPDPAGQRFSLPAWIPGSYLVRDFARHIVSIRAESAGREIALEKLDKQTWRAAPCARPVVVTAVVYAWDLSVRGAHLDATHGFFNGTSVFLRVAGREQERCEVEIRRPVGARYRRWRVATALSRDGAPAHGFGRYAAADYDELIDHPVEMGTFDLVRFEACGIPHEVAITGRHAADLDRLRRDLARLCEMQIRFWHGPRAGRAGGPKLPFDRYVFLVTAVGDGYGGLEHRASTALLCSRDDLPEAGGAKPGDGYRTFLGLASHEYFHTWNVKRLKPAAFTPYDLERENYTTLLWAFEGITSYYDDLLLVRCGLVSEKDYLEILARSVTSLLRTPGRAVQTVADASFDAWIKYYRPDENAPNAQVSYYLKGSLVALALDLTIRSRTRGARSLDDVMRALWVRYGAKGIGVPEGAIEDVAAEAAGTSLRAFFDRALRSTRELPLVPLLAEAGLTLKTREAESASDRGGKAAKNGEARRRRASLGLRTSADPLGVKVTHVISAGAGERAGIAAGDVIVAVDGLRAAGATLEPRLARRRPGERVRLHLFRRDELHEIEAELAAPVADTAYVEPDARAKSGARLRAAWLKGK
ncbi:MAG: PDZ domain-containing protein [Burkholderiales bacterium]|jgi:predicted metalloprotease with PDZ domain|nr:PDZ domain-containing protein [Burkholderiales bacterium]